MNTQLVWLFVHSELVATIFSLHFLTASMRIWIAQKTGCRLERANSWIYRLRAIAVLCLNWIRIWFPRLYRDLTVFRQDRVLEFPWLRQSLYVKYCCCYLPLFSRGGTYSIIHERCWSGLIKVRLSLLPVHQVPAKNSFHYSVFKDGIRRNLVQGL